MSVVMRTGVEPPLRTVMLRAMAAWSRKMVRRTVAVRPLTASTRSISSVSASAASSV